MNIPVKNIYYLLCYAWDHMREGETVDLGSEEFGGMVDLFAKVLNEGVARIISRGLDRDYLTVHEDIADSGPCRSVIPFHADHRFRLMPIADSDMPIGDSDKPITDSEACRSPWSERVATLENLL